MRAWVYSPCVAENKQRERSITNPKNVDGKQNLAGKNYSNIILLDGAISVTA
jgi:hypothetical protein